MKSYQLHSRRATSQNNAYVLRWIFIAVLILFLGYTAIPSSPDLVQRRETTIGQHETIHNIDTGSTSSPLTKAMNVLFYHPPAQRERASIVPGKCDHFHKSAHWKQCTEISVEGGSQPQAETESSLYGYYRHHKPKTQGPDSENVDDNSIHDLMVWSENVQRRGKSYDFDFSHNSNPLKNYGRSAKAEMDYDDDFPHNNNNGKHHCRGAKAKEVDIQPAKADQGPTLTQFCHTRKCKKENTRNNIGSYSLKGFKECSCNSCNPRCHCPHHRLPLLERILTNEENENVAVSNMGELAIARKPADTTSRLWTPTKGPGHADPIDSIHESVVANCGELDVTRPSADHESNEKEVKDQLSARYNIEADDEEHDTKGFVNPSRPRKCPPRIPRTPKCPCPYYRPPQVERILENDETESFPVSDVRASDVSRKEADHGVDEEVKCQLRIRSRIDNDEEERSTLSNVKDLEVIPNFEEERQCNRTQYHEKQGCSCPICTGESPSRWDDRSTLTDVRELDVSQELSEVLAVVPPKCSCASKKTKCPCRDQRPHLVMHERQRDPMPSLADHSGPEAEQISSLRKPPVENDDFETSEQITESEARSRRWPISLDMKTSNRINVNHSPRISIAKTTTQIRSERWWLRRHNCRPRPANNLQVKSELEVDNIVSIDEPSSSPIVVLRSPPYHKKLRVNGRLPTQSHTPKLKAVTVRDHPVLRRNDTLLESITKAQCHDKVAKDKEDCEEKNRIGTWVVGSLLAVVGICGLSLILLVLLTRARRKRSSPLLVSTGPEHKSGLSTPATSISELQLPRIGRPAACVLRRIDEDGNDDTSSVRRYTTLDGASDGWTKWLKQKRDGKIAQTRRFSPTPLTRAPRIPTLKLPQPTLATMRKVSGLGSELEGSVQGKQTWKDKGKDSSRVKWCSTV